MTGTSMRGAGRLLVPATIVLLLAACASPQGVRTVRTTTGETAAAATPAGAPAVRGGGGYYLDDGPGANPPRDLASIPDAVPRAERILAPTTRPYSVFGRRYTPMARLEPFSQRGVATWYGRRYHGQPTSSGERYDMYAMTAAHPTLPIPSYVRVTHVGNGRSVVVRVNDRGPFLHDRVIDLSYTAAAKLGYVESGSAEVDVELITRFDEAATTVATATTATTTTAATTTGAAAATAVGAAVGTPIAATAGSSTPVPPRATPVAARTASVADRAAPVATPAAAVATPAAAAASPAARSATPGAATPSAGAAPAALAAAEPLRLSVETVYTSNQPPRAEARPDATAMPEAAAPAGAGYWLQLGAFASLDSARDALAQLARRLAWLGTAFDIRHEGALYKVQAGPWHERERAVAAAERIRAATELRPFPTLR